MQDQINSNIDYQQIFLIYTTTPAPRIDQPQRNPHPPNPPTLKQKESKQVVRRFTPRRVLLPQTFSRGSHVISERSSRQRMALVWNRARY